MVKTEKRTTIFQTISFILHKLKPKYEVKIYLKCESNKHFEILFNKKILRNH